ncbi:MAG TPA: aspartate--tRNA(Asn) ligase, partial [Candidatus Limnocylindria bacterium]|nr:aspartate--tRNA(Asn) ligase [Candidatus Limnocylindria bacterium]
MRRTHAQDLRHRAGERVRLNGWLQHRRELANVTFVILRDATGTAQIALPAGDAAAIADLPNESAIEVVGSAIADTRAPGGIEVRDAIITAISRAAGPPPFELGRPSLAVALPNLLDHAALTLRHPRRRAVFYLMAAAVSAFREHLRKEGFTEVFTPKIVATATESGANCFRLDYFGRVAYLAQSPQLYKQMLVGVFERVFEVAPVFRAEPHDTPRHLNEYVSLDAEMCFIADHRDVMATLERTVVSMARAVSEHPNARDAGARLPIRGELPFPALHFADALDLLEIEFGASVRMELDLAPAQERWLGEWALRQHGSDFLFVTGFPMVKRPFYTHPDPARPSFSNSFDLLFRGLEVVTGGQRLDRLDEYEAALAARSIDPAPFAGYLEAFRYGMPPHGGFALGIER